MTVPAMLVLSIFAAAAQAEKIDSDTTLAQNNHIVLTEDTTFTNEAFFVGQSDFQITGDHKATIRSTLSTSGYAGQFFAGKIDVDELVIEDQSKYSNFDFNVGGNTGRDGDEIDAFAPVIRANRLTLKGVRSMSVWSAADIEVGRLEATKLELHGGTTKADQIVIEHELLINAVDTQDWTPSSQLALHANRIEAMSVNIDATPGDRNVDVRLDVGELVVGGGRPSLTLTNVADGLRYVTIAGKKPPEGKVVPPAFVRLKGENRLGTLVVQSNSGIYQPQTKNSFGQEAANLSIERVIVENGASLRVGGMTSYNGGVPPDGIFDDGDVTIGSSTQEITPADFNVEVGELVLANGASLRTRMNGPTMSDRVSKSFHIDTLTVDLTADADAQNAVVHANGPLDADRIVVLTNDTSKQFIVTDDQVNDGTSNSLTEDEQAQAAQLAADAKFEVVGAGTLNNGTRSDAELLGDLANSIDLGRTQLDEGNRIRLLAEEGEVMGALEAQADWTSPESGGDGSLAIDDGTIVRRANEKTTGIAEVASLTFLQWRAELDDMQSRLGDLRNAPSANGLWVRTYGGKAEYGTQSVDMDYAALQMGYDHSVAAAQGRLYLGGAASWTDMDGDFARGSAEGHVLAFTGYASWVLDSGLYFDATAKYGTLQNRFDMRAADVPYDGRLDTQFVAASLQTGLRHMLSANLYVEPQMQFTAGHIFSDSYRTSHGLEVTQESFDSLIGRAGVAAGWVFPEAKGSLYGKLSYLYDFDGEEETRFAMAGEGASRYQNDFGGGWWEAAAGAQWRFSPACYGFAEFSYGDGGDIDSPYRWSVGLRYAY